MLDRLRRLFSRPATESPSPDGPSDQGDFHGVRFRLHREEQVLRLGMPERSFPQLHPTIPRSPGQPFVSAAMLAHKAKQLDDGLYAAVELAAQNGAGAFRAKRDLLDRLIDRVDGDGHARATLEAAAKVGGVRETCTAQADTVAQEFLADALRSKPLGFYTWSDDLGRIFRQDRLLQSDLAGSDDVVALLSALHDAPELRVAYEANLRLVERVTNPLALPDLRPMLASLDAGTALELPRKFAFSPPSIAHETELVKRLYGDRPIPDGFDLMTELVSAVRSGALDLTPRDASGWYDVQTWALETLVAPERAAEAQRLVLEPRYAKHLENLFRAILTATRETHVKQLEMPMAGCAAQRIVHLPVRPQLTVEPLPTYYSRRAEAYRFVHALLMETFGEPALHEMHGLRGGRGGGRARVEVDLGEELAATIRLFEGAAATAMHELGVQDAPSSPDFARWAKACDDPDLDADARLMVPVYYDLERRKTKVWMILGWTGEDLVASFEKPPRIEILGGAKAQVKLESAYYPLPAPVMAEALVGKLLDRDEFRALCDRYRSPEEILAALG